MVGRPDRDNNFLDIAEKISEMATCDRLSVGAIVVQNGTQVAAGYNGSPRKLEHCDDVDHMMVDGHCKRVVHAEVNAIVNAARNGASTMGATLYCNYMPCWDCFKTIINAGIAEVVYRNVYKSEDERVVESASTVGIGLRHIVKQE